MKGKINVNGLLLISLGFSLGSIGLRILYTGKIYYGFLAWNLFLAFLPYCFSVLLISWKQAPSLLQWLLLCLWLLFYPNAPYIITDLFHLRERNPVPLWYDTALLFFAAWNGLLLGILSLMKVEGFLEYKFGKRISFWLVVISFLACGFGIYTGRFLRYNSWELFTNPQEMAMDLAPRFAHPLYYSGTWGMTFVFALFLGLIYVSFKKMIHAKI